jgi:CheY-like chemotaxis protein
VSDTGIGMEAEFLAHLFGPLRAVGSGLARGRQGLGLGLALVKGLVGMHGGTLEASSDGPGQGSRFIVRLPVVKSAAATPGGRGATREAPVASKGRPHRILVIEDNPDSAEGSRIMLELAGHQVEVAGDGRTALRKARSFRPDVVICDIGLPGGMDGYAVAGSLRKDPASRSAYLIALTGYGRDSDHELALNAGFDVHLTKPADPASLRRLLAGVPHPREK